MAELQTNFNIAPFYDDYDEDKQYYRILFRPATAVQARELTQIQTILQRQISRFGNSIYKDGTIIEGCNYTTYPDIEQVKFKDDTVLTLDFNTLTYNYTDFANNYLLVSNNSGLRASIFKAYAGAEAAVNFGSQDTNRAYVIYVNTGNSSGIAVSRFSTTSEQIDVYSSNQDKTGILNPANKVGVVYTLTSNSSVNALGLGYGLHFGSGVIYQKGFFLKTLPNDFIIREHNGNAAGMVVGFETKEYIVTPTEDDSLYDNSIGSTNYNAPGAYRLKLVPEPIAYDAANNLITIPKNFLRILEYDGGDGRIVESHTVPQYSLLMDELAKRTAEESGDYVVKPFQVDISAHESNNYSFYYNASPGIAYVDGYRVELLSPRKIEVERGISSNTLASQYITMNIGNNIKVDNVAGVLNYNDLQEIEIRDAVQEVLSLDQARTTPAGALIGKANVRGVSYYDEHKGTSNGIHNIHIFNIRMNAGKSFQTDAKSLYAESVTYGTFYSDIILDVNGKASIDQNNLNRAIFDTGLPSVKRLTNASGVNNTSFVYKPILTGQLIPDGVARSKVEFVVNGGDNFAYGIGMLTDKTSEAIDIIFGQNANSNVLCNVTITTTSIITSSDDWTHLIKVGQGLVLKKDSTVTYHTVTGITDENVATIVPPTGITQSTTDVETKLFFKKGTYVDLAGSGNTFTFTSSTAGYASLQLDPESATYDMYAQIPAARVTATPIEKVVHKNTYVKIDCSTHFNGSNGPWNLGLPDVYKIANVHVGSTYSESNPDYSTWFNLDTGQTDSHYGLSQLVASPQYAKNISSSTKLLVKLNHFTANITATKTGFFSVESYPINDDMPDSPNYIQTAEVPIYYDTSQLGYDLRNHIDCRFYLANTAVVATTIEAANTNPANNYNTFKKGNPGEQIVAGIGENMIYDVEFYLPRYDVFIINRDGNLEVKEGIPSLQPQRPALNKTGMPIAEIFVPPYPSLTFKEAE
jgi:hypothetical protein